MRPEEMKVAFDLACETLRRAREGWAQFSAAAARRRARAHAEQVAELVPSVVGAREEGQRLRLVLEQIAATVGGPLPSSDMLLREILRLVQGDISRALVAQPEPAPTSGDRR